MSLHETISNALRLAGIARESQVFTLEVHAGQQDMRIAIAAIAQGAVVEWQDATGIYSCQIVDGAAGPVEQNETFVLDTIGGGP